MNIINRIERLWSIYAPVWLQVIVSMWWLFAGFILMAFVIYIVSQSIGTTISDPEGIGEYFGKIIRGFNSQL